MQTQLQKTVLYDRHVSQGAQMVDFGGWEMPVQYPSGIVQEHLNTRKFCGIFDVSHMGRLIFSGADALPFLQHVLSNNAAALEVGESQYTIIPNEQGGAIDDAYLYRFIEDEYLLVVNASNRKKDVAHFKTCLKAFDRVTMVDKTSEMAMISVQGPLSKKIIENLLEEGQLPEPMRNKLSIITLNGVQVLIARTGYTGEPLCFELFVDTKDAVAIWEHLIEQGASAIGLGARDTLRLETALPLYGHEFGLDPEKKEIPIYACPLARFAVSLSPLKGAFLGREALTKQFEAFKKIIDRDYTQINDLPQKIMPVELIDRGIARAGSPVYVNDRPAGFITSGTMVPYWEFEGNGIASQITDKKARRAIALALLNSDLVAGDKIDIEIRGRKLQGEIVPYFLRSEAPPFARPIINTQKIPEDKITPVDSYKQAAHTLLTKAAANTRWRQQECINLIPSEMTPSRMTRHLSIADPVCRYAEHKPVKAFHEAEVFYYQGADFIDQVEEDLIQELRRYFGCAQVETRPISGQMSNATVFSALTDYLNRADRKSEQRRIRYVLNNHIIKGGHLSAQPMGALRDFVARDPRTEKPAVINFPVLPENSYKIDVPACEEIIARYQPELVILGKSMTLHKEPVAEIRALTDKFAPNCVVMYDMAHVLGLVGPSFQEPFKEGAHIVTGSTHKTYFGAQRGIVASDYQETDPEWDFWEAVGRRAFPGSTSNHHLGTLLGLLMSAYEMNAFKDIYQPKVIANAKAFATALNSCGLDVAGDPSIGYTETHQVILNVGYAKGPEIARRLEDNNIVLNYQAGPAEEGFTASGALRMGVPEMTRFGMQKADFQELAQLMCDVIVGNKQVKDEVIRLRKRFLTMQYCFDESVSEDFLKSLQEIF
ncbi:glycine cleavage system aminomethyltransferase GcvT [Desulfococcaceae bacterium HSG7]|nr:glycine cleavage system aminomethyltransferase GcvT [Desulfococcaceae bacterium HSG7]